MTFNIVKRNLIFFVTVAVLHLPQGDVMSQ